MNNFITIALLVTSGERDFSKTIDSISKQTEKVDELWIASEISLKGYDNLVINPYKKGLARNTMQALLKIKMKYPDKKILIGTIDDDDYWTSDFVEKAKSSYAKNHNFITGFLSVYNKKIEIDKYIFKKKDITKKTFIVSNPGIQGSNKFFDLDLALESGGMPKHINASTDRAFNINMLSHPEVNLDIISSIVSIYNKDSDRERITNDSKRIQSIRKFYKHYSNLINDDLIAKIEKRHKDLHNLKGVIVWK